MATRTNKSEAKTKPKDRYLKVPYAILNLRDLGLCEKVLLSHIYGFGAKGCWQSNDTLAEILMVCSRTITKWVSTLKKAGLIQVKSEKGYYRTMWAASHPDVKESARLWYRNQEIPNPCRATAAPRATSSMEGGNNVPTQCAQSSDRPGKMLPPTNNTTKQETTPETTAPPSPLPAGGQASAVLTDRRQADRRRIEQVKQNFGRARKPFKPMGEDEFEKRRNQQILALKNS